MDILLGRPLTFGDEQQIKELKRMQALDDIKLATQRYINELEKYIDMCDDLTEVKIILREELVELFYDIVSPELLSSIIDDIWKEAEFELE